MTMDDNELLAAIKEGRERASARPFRMPKCTNLMLTNWCRISWYGEKVGPPFRFHFVWSEGPHLWCKIFRLDTAFHRYEPDGQRIFPWMGA